LSHGYFSSSTPITWVLNLVKIFETRLDFSTMACDVNQYKPPKSVQGRWETGDLELWGAECLGNGGGHSLCSSQLFMIPDIFLIQTDDDNCTYPTQSSSQPDIRPVPTPLLPPRLAMVVPEVLTGLRCVLSPFSPLPSIHLHLSTCPLPELLTRPQQDSFWGAVRPLPLHGHPHHQQLLQDLRQRRRRRHQAQDPPHHRADHGQDGEGQTD
jgi:hypothetical protein